MLVRHGEKPGEGSPPHGVNKHGERDEHSLSVQGWTRAGALVQLFAPDAGTARSGLARPTAVYAAGGSGGEGSVRARR